MDAPASGCSANASWHRYDGHDVSTGDAEEPISRKVMRCFDGPADLVIEVTLPGAESADTLVKRRR
jgi:hypothetical protein